MSTLTTPIEAETLPFPARLKATDLARAGLEGLRGRPLRATLSALGIAIGIAALVAVLGISTVSRAGLMQQLDELGTNMLTVQAGQSLTGQSVRLPGESVGMVRQVTGVESVSAVGTVPSVTVRRSDRIPPAESNGITVMATRLDLLDTIGGQGRDPLVGSGAFLNKATARYPAVVLGSVAARRLGFSQAGDDVYIAGRWFTVVGILSPLPLTPEIDRAALLGWSAADSLGFDGHPTQLYERSADSAVSAVRDVLPATVSPEHPEEVDVSRPSDALSAKLAAQSAFNGLVLGLGGVALLVGGVGIANIMVISVLERRREIGLRRALGATRGQIRLQFLTESVALSLLGGLLGLLIGVGITLGYAVHRGWPLVLSAQIVAGGVAAAVVIGAAAGLYPARRAAALPPTQALAS